MSNDSEKTDKTWKQIIGLMIQTPFYPVHFAIRLIARFLLLAIRSIALLLLLILFVFSILSFKIFDSALSKVLDLVLSKTLVESTESLVFPPIITIIIPIIIVIIAIVLIPHLIQRHAKDIWESLLKIRERISEVLRSGWLPGLDIKESLSVTWQDYGAKIWPSWREIFNEFRKLCFATLILFIAFVVYVGVVYAMSPKEWKIYLFPRTLVYIHDHSHPDINKKIPDHSHKPSTSYPFEKGTKFSLVYKEGDLKSKKGICPEGSNLKRLELFKTMISDSPKDGRLKLKIKGFASIAPVPVNGIINDKQSNSLNRQIANERAEALIYFLTTEPYDSTKCRSALDDDGRWGRKEDKPYTRGRPDTLAWKGSGFTVTYDDSPRVQWEGSNLTVSYKPWESYNEMNKEKPLKNPPENSQNKEDRQLDREFLNRSVQIIIEEGNDRTETMPATPAEDNTGQAN